MFRRFFFIGLLCVLAIPARAEEYWVSTQGDDANAGTRKAPFKTIQKAADTMGPGDTCSIIGGVYREEVRVRTSGAEGKPIRFRAAPGEKVVIDGTTLISGEWEHYREGIYRLPCGLDFPQLFVNGQMMVEARWPNMNFSDELWDLACWRSTGKGSRYGKVVDPALGKTDVDWTGGYAVLNVAHQFFTWTRTVDAHAPGSDTFTYAKDLQGITHFADKTTPWEDDYYYLVGVLEALDTPGEWFLDTENEMLYLWPPEGTELETASVQAKMGNVGFLIEGQSYVVLEGVDFFATTFQLAGCAHCVVEDCHLLFPSYSRRYNDPAAQEHWKDRTFVEGDDCIIRRCSLAYSPTAGLQVKGQGNLVEDTLVHDVCWNGSLRYVGMNLTGPPLGEEGRGSVIRHCTIYNTGNVGISYSKLPHVVEYSHVYNGGLACEDISLVYTQLPGAAGSVIRYNWVHGCHTRKGLGLGIRGDDQTRKLTVHHNVVWDCGRDGIIVKGDYNKVYNNTVLDIGRAGHEGNYINLHTRSEPKKPWRKQFPLLERQNAHSEVINNVAKNITGFNNGEPFPESPNVSHNYVGDAPQLRNPPPVQAGPNPSVTWEESTHPDFRPAEGSPLIDAGSIISGFTGDYAGEAPDIGAYEYGGDNWVAGITWSPAKQTK